MSRGINDVTGRRILSLVLSFIREEKEGAMRWRGVPSNAGFSEEVARWGMCIVYSETHHARCALYALSIIVKCIARPTFLDVIAPAVAGDEEIPYRVQIC